MSGSQVCLAAEPGLAGMRQRPLAAQIRLALGLSTSAALVLGGGAAHAQSGLALEEIIVTAQKRAESIQDVPISAIALDQRALDDLNIADLDDIVFQLPSVSIAQRRPGWGNVFMRGISDGTNGNQSLQAPSVAVYLDEQPVTAITFNLDPHIYDVARVEALMGPQGTLYGAASQAGNLRIITNQPDAAGWDAGFTVTAANIDGGDQDLMAEGFLNIPIDSRSALRLVGWVDKDGGYIDAVPDSITYPVSQLTRGNSGYVTDDFNDSRKEGLRAALKVDLADNWTGTAAAMLQELESDGIWDHDPERLGDYEVGRFFADYQKDEWEQFSVTLEGDLGFADLTFAASYLDRDIDTYSDYSHYSVSSAYVEPYYTCYEYYYGPCVDPSIQYSNLTDATVHTHELRLAGTAGAVDWILGSFHSRQEIKYQARWSIPPIHPDAAIREDFYYLTDQVREDDELALFGQLIWRFRDDLAATLGYRRFQGDTALRGFVGSINAPVDVDSQADTKDSLIRLNLSWHATEDIMLYGTYAEGYRPGGANRSPVIGETYQPDFLDSFELGMKSFLAGGALRLNATAYYMEWDDFQLGFYDPSLSLLALVDNAGSAESKGLELEVDWLAAEGLQFSLRYSFNDASLTEDYRTELADPAAMLDEGPEALSGQELTFAPEHKFSALARYEFTVNDWPAAAQVNYAFTDSMFNDIQREEREEMDAYGLWSASFSIAAGRWRWKVFGENLTGEVAELYINSIDVQRLVTVNKPRTLGVSLSMTLD